MVNNGAGTKTCGSWPTDRQSTATRLLVLAASTLLVVGCSIGAKTRADFRTIDDLATRLALDQLGTIRIDEKSGSHQVIEGPTPLRRIVVLIHQRPAQVQTMIDARLKLLGYSTEDRGSQLFCASTHPCRYFHATSGVHIVLSIYTSGKRIQAGDKPDPGRDTAVPASESGLEVDISKP